MDAPEAQEPAAVEQSGIPALAAAPRGIYGPDDRPHERVVPIVFVGGTGRSGTHVVARFLGRHNKIAAIPVECRFHTEPGGFPGLLAGEVPKQKFIRRLRGFWWKGWQGARRRGMFRIVPRERFDAAVDTFDRRFDAEPEAACRALFLDLLWPRAIEKGASGIVEQSTDVVVAAPTLMRLFPEARFIHVVRDGRDASASRVSQTRGLIYPRTRRQGLEWWERRMRAIDEAARKIPEDRLLEVRLEGLLVEERRKAGKKVVEFAGVSMGKRVRKFLRIRMSSQDANEQRWRRGLSDSKAADLDRRYSEILDRFEADGVTSLPLLRDSAGEG